MAYNPEPCGQRLLARLDESTTLSMCKVQEDATHWYYPEGRTCKGFAQRQDALQYAGQVAAYFSAHGLAAAVHLVQGPTRFCRDPFVVTDDPTSGAVLQTVRLAPARHPAPGMTLRTVIACFGIEALRGMALQDGRGKPMYVSDSLIDKEARDWADSPTEMFRIARLYGGDSPQADMVDWIYTGTTVLAAQAESETEALPAPRC